MTENKITKSKYFQFITDDIVESQIISYNGTIIPLPKDWSYRKVKVVFNDSISQEMYVKDNGNISYVMVAKFYLGTSAIVKLISNLNNKNKDESSRDVAINNLVIAFMGSAIGIILSTCVSLSITLLTYL